jgi:SAM-dependent methyltransferase
VELYHFPTDLEQIIDDFTGRGPNETRQLAEAVLELSDLFVGRAPWGGEYARSEALRRAYLCYYLPVNVPKIRVPLSEWLRRFPRRLAGLSLRCLDLGAGPGSALLGLVDFVRGLPADERPRRLEMVALDQSFASLKDAEQLLRRFAERAGIAIDFHPMRLDLVAERSDLFALASAAGPFDLVIAANVICEIVRESADGEEGLTRAAALLSASAKTLLSPQGSILVIEPGLRETARNLHRLRDRVLTSTALHVQAPCLHEAPCPALTTRRDWCIVDFAWEPPAIVAALDRHTGLRKGSLKFAYMVLTLEPVSSLPATTWRVVSDVLDLKGERRAYLCSEGRWIVLRQLKREAGDAAEAFASLRRGDLVEISGVEPKGALFRLPPSGSIRRVRRAFTPSRIE